jgi:uncharacterized protein DUF5694
MRTVLVIPFVLAVSQHAWAQSDTRPEILVLGTYHMANPGRDIHNMAADDVLSPKRQQELSQLLEVLKRFRPTKIAIEASAGSERITRDYNEYLAGRYTLTRNENDQIGFRLAKELGLKTVHAVDVDGDFQFMRVSNYAKANGKSARFDSMQASVAKRVKQQGDFLQSHTVLETLDRMNSDSAAAEALASDMEFVYFGDLWEFAGPDLLTFWFQRNLRIYNRIAALIESPADRILVIYGNGHLGPFRQIISADARVRLRKLSDLTGTGAVNR